MICTVFIFIKFHQIEKNSIKYVDFNTVRIKLRKTLEKVIRYINHLNDKISTEVSF